MKSIALVGVVDYRLNPINKSTSRLYSELIIYYP